MSDFLYRQLRSSSNKYSEKKIRRSIIIIRNSSNKRLIEKQKRIIFDCVGKMILKNVNNFFNLIKDIENGHVIHERDDIVIECYLIVDKCIEKFDLLEKKYKFYFYVNKSLGQGLFRLKEKNYGFKTGKYSHKSVEELVDRDEKTFCYIKNYPLFLEKNFTNKEILLMQSKLQEEKIEDFCKKIEITKSEYYRLLKRIKSKIDKNYLT